MQCSQFIDLTYFSPKILWQAIALNLTATIVTKYYWENASSAIASSREHLYAHQNAGRAATHGGLACPGSWAWCARGLRIESRGSHHIIAQPILHQIGFSGSGVMVNTSKHVPLSLHKCQVIFDTHYIYILADLVLYTQWQEDLSSCQMTTITSVHYNCFPFPLLKSLIKGPLTLSHLLNWSLKGQWHLLSLKLRKPHKYDNKGQGTFNVTNQIFDLDLVTS